LKHFKITQIVKKHILLGNLLEWEMMTMTIVMMMQRRWRRQQ